MNVKPKFAQIGGFTGGVSAVLLTSLDYTSDIGKFAFVGTNSGKCILFCFSSYKRLSTVLDDAEHRHIMELGEWKFDLSSNNSSFFIWIHFRSSAIEIFEVINYNATDKSLIKLKLFKRMTMSHYGFCRSIADWSNVRFFIPEYQDDTNVVRIRNENSSEKCLILGAAFLNESFIKYQLSKSIETRIEEDLIKSQKYFSGMLMAIKPFKNTSFKSANTVSFECIFLVFEDSTIALYNFRLKKIIDAIKHPKHQQFICCCILHKEDNSVKNRIFIAVSVMSQSFLMSFNLEKEMFEIHCVIRKTKSINCTTMEFVDCKEQFSIACGLNTGSIEIYVLNMENLSNLVPQKVKIIDFHLGHSIQYLQWNKIQVEDQNKKSLENENSKNLQSYFLFVGCTGEKFAWYKL